MFQPKIAQIGFNTAILPYSPNVQPIVNHFQNCLTFSKCCNCLKRELLFLFFSGWLNLICRATVTPLRWQVLSPSTTCNYGCKPFKKRAVRTPSNSRSFKHTFDHIKKEHICMCSYIIFVVYIFRIISC